MRVRLQAFWLPKAGNSSDEFEDAFAPDVTPEPRDFEEHRFNMAVADGATDSIFSREWAKLLANAYAMAPHQFLRPSLTASKLDELSSRWAAVVKPSTDVPWYVEWKLAEGAFATLVGLTLMRKNRWRAFAVGDSCMFQVRGGELRTRFPVTSAADFNNSPVLIATNATHNKKWTTSRRMCKGEWQRGDVFLLMSDALAQSYLRDADSAGQTCESMDDVVNQEHFREFVECRRREAGPDDLPLLRNDDVTLLRCAIP